MPRKPKPKTKNTNGEGSVYFAKSRNKWCAAIIDPHKNRIAARFDTKEEADKWLTVKLSEFYKNEYIPPTTITVGEWYMEYVMTYCAPNVKRKTLADYVRTGKKLAPIADIKLQTLNAAAVQKFYNNLPPMAPSSKYKIHTMLNSAIAKAHALGIIQKNVMLAVNAPKNTKVDVEIFTVAEVQQILTTVQNSRYYSKYYVFILAALSTGARLGELLGLKLSKVNNGSIVISNNIVTVHNKLYEETPKTNAGRRTITISGELEKLLREKALEGKITPIDPYVFHNSKGGLVWPRNIERVWKNILIEAQIEHKKFHTLRHTHATQLLAAGVPLLEVAKRLGHSDPAHTLRLYGHFIPGYDTKIPEKVNEVFQLKG